MGLGADGPKRVRAVARWCVSAYEGQPPNRAAAFYRCLFTPTLAARFQSAGRQAPLASIANGGDVAGIIRRLKDG